MQKDVVLAVGSVKTTLRDTEGYFTVLAQQWKKKTWTPFDFSQDLG